VTRRAPVHVLFVDHPALPITEAVSAFSDRIGASVAAQAFADTQRAIEGHRPLTLDWREDADGRFVAEDLAIEADFVVLLLEVGS
jgi:hypothetical protein